MVNPATFPAQRRGPSGPAAGTGGGGGDFEPFDNERWFDPNYVDSDENGSIADPFTDWDTMVAALGTEGWQVHFPAYPVAPGAAEIAVEGNLLFVGTSAKQTSSYINDAITLSSGGTSESVTFRDLYLESITLTDGGEGPITFENCVLVDMVVDGLWEGEIYGVNSQFLIGQVTNDCNVHLQGGFVMAWSAQSFELTDCLVGDGTSAGTIEITGPSITCRGVTFTPGSTIEFLNAAGTVYLDPESYKSFLDNDIVIINDGPVVRLDGSFPEEAITYAGTGTVEINWFKNPRAYVEQTGPIDFEFIDPLTTPLVTLIVDNQTSGEGFETFSWPANCTFSAGDPPEQEEGISVYKLEYESSLNTYFVYVIGMNFLDN